MAPRRDSIRRVDWRFLLDDAQLREVATIDGERDRLLIDAVRHLGATVVGASAVGEEGVDTVLARDPDGDAIGRALALRSPNGSIVVQSSTRRARRDVAARLRRAGLSVRQYGCWPTCAGATRFVPLDDRTELIASASAAKNRHRRAVGTVLARIGLGSQLFSHTTSIATTGPHSPAPLRVAAEDGDDPRGTLTLLTPRFGSSRHVIALIVDARGRQLVVKTPRVPGDDGQLRLEADGLTSIAGQRPLRPMLVADGERFGQRWLVQTRVVGEPLSRRHVARHPERWLTAARAWLDDMPVEGRSTPDDDGRSDRLIRPALDVVSACSDHEPALRRLVADASSAFEQVRSTPLPVVAEHGDFRPPNLIISGPDAIGAVDWELAERSGLPLHDLVFFHAFAAEVAPQVRPDLQQLGAAALASLELDPDLLGPLSAIAMLRQLANLVRRGTGSVGGAPEVARSDIARAWFATLNDRLGDGSGVVAS